MEDGYQSMKASSVLTVNENKLHKSDTHHVRETHMKDHITDMSVKQKKKMSHEIKPFSFMCIYRSRDGFIGELKIYEKKSFLFKFRIPITTL